MSVILAPKVVVQYAGGKGPIVLDEIRCSGNETNLLQCNHDDIGQHNCHHLDDIGVSCGKLYLIKKCFSCYTMKATFLCSEPSSLFKQGISLQNFS